MTDNDNLLKEYIPLTSIKLLDDFSKSANKDTGSSHPDDEKRWFDFIISVVKSGSNLPVDALQDWLQADGWSEERADRLSSEFEFGASILYHYKGLNY